MRIIDLTSAPRTFEFNPRSAPAAHPSFLPNSSSPPRPDRKPPSPDQVSTESPYFTEMKRAASKATPRATPRPALNTVSSNSLIPAFFSTSNAGTPTSHVTPKPRPRAPPKQAVPSSDDFEGIEEISETDITAEELLRSEQRRAERAQKRLSSSKYS